MTLTRQACTIQDNLGQGTKMVFTVCMEHALILNMPCSRIRDFPWIKNYMIDSVLMLHTVPRSELTNWSMRKDEQKIHKNASQTSRWKCYIMQPSFNLKDFNNADITE